ncbi:MAG: amidohydrolase family protein, partial [Janthinobacterium lividum]
AAGPDGVVLVTDAMVAAGMPDGPYRLGSLEVHVTDGQARLVGADGTPGSIAGSTLTTGRAFALVAALTGDLAAAARFASTNAARHFGLDAGTVEPGGPADLCLVDDDGTLQRVMCRGRWIEAA